jgi:hypothetical protein
LIQGCEFRQNQQHVLLGKEWTGQFTGNLFAGPVKIQNDSGKQAQIDFNAASS